LTVTLKVEHLAVADLNKLSQHIAAMEGQRRILNTLGVFSWKGLMKALEQDPEHLTSVRDRVGLSVYDEDAIRAFGTCPASVNAHQLGLQYTIWPDADVFDTNELFEIEKVSGLEIEQKKIDMAVRIHCRV